MPQNARESRFTAQISGASMGDVLPPGFAGLFDGRDSRMAVEVRGNTAEFIDFDAASDAAFLRFILHALEQVHISQDRGYSVSVNGNLINIQRLGGSQTVRPHGGASGSDVTLDLL